MSTSNRKIATEAAAAGTVAAGLAVLCSTSDPWLGSGAAHPAWLAVLVLSAFYGLRGLLIALPIVWGAVAITSLAVGADFAGVAARATGRIDLFALVASVAVAGISMAHARSRRVLRDELEALRATAAEDGVLIDGLTDNVRSLRARCDRVDLSIAYWRDIASRLEGPDPKGAAGAALELCLQRTGARAGIVRRFDGAALHNVAWRGRWSEQMPTPRDIFRDATMTAALEGHQTVLAEQVDGTRTDDADIAAPITSPIDGSIVGVLALRGLSRSRLRAADIRDVAATAQWLANAFSSDRSSPLPAFSRPATETGANR